MSKPPLRILTISWDQTLAMDNPSFGDAQKRNIDYGKFVENIYLITYSSKKNNLKNKQLAENVFVYPTNSANAISFIFDAWRIAQKICSENKIDLVLTQDPFLTGLIGSWVKKKFGSKFLIHFHGDFWQNHLWLKEHWYNYLFLILEKILVFKADAIRVMSGSQKNKLVSAGIAENKIRVISTPVDIEKFLAVNNPASFKALVPMVLHIGRDDVVKDYDTLYQAFNLVSQRHKPVRFYQVGGGKNSQKAKDLLLAKAKKAGKNLDLNIAIEPLQNQSILIEKYYMPAYLVMLSSTSESFGKVLVEANAAGKPIISTATTGAKEIIRAGYNGFLTPIGDASALADKILFLLNNPSQAQAMGENGRQLVQEKFDGKTNAEKIVKFWCDIIENNL